MDEPYDLMVSTAATDSFQNLMLREIIEATLDIALNNPWVGIGVPFTVFCHIRGRECSPDMFQRSVTTPSGPEAIRYLKESGFKERLDDLLDGTGNYSVFYRWHPERSELPRFATLGYPHPSGRRRNVGTILQLLSHSFQICVYALRVDVFYGDPVDPWSSLALV